MPGICIVVLDHRHDPYLRDLVGSIRLFCPDVEVALYNSADRQVDPDFTDLPVLPNSRPLRYAKVTPFFLDLLEWAADEQFDHVVNAETDMAFVQPGFASFVHRTMRDLDYLAPGFARHTPLTSRWRPYRSLRAELQELLSIVGLPDTNRCFSPGQVFSARYARAVVNSPWYGQLRDFVTRNQEPGRSFSLQEVLMPTLADALGLRAGGYPEHLASVNRYRPYHASASVARARDIADAYFVHPIRRDDRDPARMLVRAGISGRSRANPR
jgi:hypothetical protein